MHPAWLVVAVLTAPFVWLLWRTLADVPRLRCRFDEGSDPDSLALDVLRWRRRLQLAVFGLLLVPWEGMVLIEATTDRGADDSVTVGVAVLGLAAASIAALLVSVQWGEFVRTGRLPVVWPYRSVSRRLQEGSLSVREYSRAVAVVAAAGLLLFALLALVGAVTWSVVAVLVGGAIAFVLLVAVIHLLSRRR